MKNNVLIFLTILVSLSNFSCKKKDDNPSPSNVTSVASSTYTKNGLSVTFTNTSTNSPTSYSWNFGDGTALSTVKDPVHTYAAAGTYTVVLTVRNTGGSTTHTQSITVAELAPAIASSTYTKMGLTVTFTNASTNNPTSYSWNFGDGTAVNTGINPVHRYSAAGTYTVTLTATNSDGSSTQTQSIIVKQLNVRILAVTLRSIAFYSGGPLETDGSKPDYFFTTTGAVIYSSAVANEVSSLPYTWTLPTPIEITVNKFATGFFVHTKEYDSQYSSENLFSEGYALSTYPTYPSKIRLDNSTQATELTVEWYE